MQRNAGPQNALRPGFHSRAPMAEQVSGSAARANEEKQTRAGRICVAITEEIGGFGRARALHERKMRDLLDGLSPQEINNLRYRLFAPHYDAHMSRHERAIGYLFRQLVAIEKAAFRPVGKPLIHDRIIELSCGTGTIIKLLSNSLPQSRASRVGITANDLSDDMKAIARKKLAGLPCSVEFTAEDLRSLPFRRRSYGTAILSQTLHLITDDEVVRQERDSGYMFIDGKRHLDPKYRVIRKAWDLLETDGTMIIIDEWPALLSDRGGPLGAGFAYLFNDGLRGIDWSTFQHSIMSEMRGVSYAVQVKVPIDSVHTMYLHVYRKDGDKLERNEALPPGRKFAKARAAAIDRIIDSFKAIDPDFIKSVKPPNRARPWVRFLPIAGSAVHNPKVGGSPSPGRYNCVILSGRIHELSYKKRHKMMLGAIRMLKLGGSLLLIDEFPPPRGSAHPVRHQTDLDAYLDRLSKNLIFGGEIRVPIAPPYTSTMRGYLYRKVF